MMTSKHYIALEQVGKKYNYEWIFRHLSHRFAQGVPTAITGANGSGKSTLLQVISGSIPPSEGQVLYYQQGKAIEEAAIHRQVAWAAPAMELIEELSAWELLRFQEGFRPWQAGLSAALIIEKLRLAEAKHKPIKFYSSGMKQRLKLGLAFYADTPALLLDEPCSNLDAQNTAWYQEEVQAQLAERIVIISSNQPEEYHFCKNIIQIA
jgi:ABC-type multidrug transport system ATPase subunit